MALYDGTWYNGTIEGPGRWGNSSKGTLGFSFSIRCDETNDLTDFTIWLTPKTAERAIESFEIFGITAADLGNASYAENHLPSAVEGKPLSFKMKEEEYNGRRSLKVAFIGARREAMAEGSAGAAAAKFFRKAAGLATAAEIEKPAPKNEWSDAPPDDGAPPHDDDIPF